MRFATRLTHLLTCIAPTLNLHPLRPMRTRQPSNTTFRSLREWNTANHADAVSSI